MWSPTLSIRRERGFTLLEVLVAIAIMGVIMLLVQTTGKQLLDAKARVEERDLLLQEGRVLLRKVSDDITGAFLTKKNPVSLTSTGQFLAPTTVRTVPRPVTFFIGEDRGDQDQLRLTTLSHLRRFQNAKESDQAKVEYRLEPMEEDRSLHKLLRVEIPWIDELTEVQGRAFVLGEGIREFNLQYYDTRKEEWGAVWNTEQIDWRERLPEAVRIVVSFPDPDNPDQSVTLMTGVFLPLAQGTIDF